MKLLNDFNTSVRKAFLEIDSDWDKYSGLVICGSWPGENDEQFFFECVKRVKEAKEADTPILGICFGFQVIGVVQGFELKKLPYRQVGIKFTEKGWWGDTYESYWHDYGVFDDDYQINFYRIENPLMMGVQFHPEYESSKTSPHPVLKEFLEVCKKNTFIGQ